jgi:hypothetical protein
MTNELDDRTFSQAAAAVGMTPSALSRFLRRKGFRGRKGNGSARLINRHELATLTGRLVTDKAWAACGASASQAPQRDWPPFDLGCVRRAFSYRDREWQRQLSGRGLRVAAPPIPAEFLPEFGTQHLYSPEEVAELVAVAIARRDDVWRHWITDASERAVHPNGPPMIGTDEFFSPKAARAMAEAAQAAIDKSCEQGASNGHC